MPRQAGVRRYVFVLAILPCACTAKGALEVEEEPRAVPSCHRQVGPDAMLLPYDAFGPQAMSFGLIGMGWWQWDGEGHAFDEDNGKIWVVVHDDLSDEALARRFPVNSELRCDNRYVTRDDAMEFFDLHIEELGSDPESFEGLETLVEELRATQRKIARQGWSR